MSVYVYLREFKFLRLSGGIVLNSVDEQIVSDLDKTSFITAIITNQD